MWYEKKLARNDQETEIFLETFSKNSSKSLNIPLKTGIILPILSMTFGPQG